MGSVFVMAAGKGTRLAPWTSVVPKPALPVANEPALGFLLRLAARNGHREIVANASWLGDVLMGIFGDGSAHGVHLGWSIEDAPLGTAGGVLAAQDRLRDGDEPIVVLSGDGIHDVDLAAVVRTHRETDALVTLALLPVVDPSEYGVAVLDPSGRITSFQEKPARGTELSNLANTGIYVVQPEVLDRCAAWGLTDFGSELFPRMLAEGLRLQAHRLDDTYWNDIGDLDEWRATNRAVLEGRVDVGSGAWSDAGEEGVLVHPTARIGDGVELIGPCVIGAGATIGDGAVLRSALVLPNADVPAGLVVASGTVGTLDGIERWARELAGG
jgi:NDP-sugar pyrophosphorylase family protein